jgi:hypothetical protein
MDEELEERNNELRRGALRFITGIRYHRDMLERLNNMTYIYDVNWSPDNTTKATFPVAFFHVKDKGYHEVMSSEISQKQMLFYNSASERNDSDPALDSGITNIVADNIVIKPKVYKLDVIIPYHNLTLLDQSFVFNTHTHSAVVEELLSSKSDKAVQYINAWSTLSTPYTKFIKDLLRLLINQNYSQFDLNSWITDTVQQPDYNKQSLEIMWQMRHIVKMKMWNSWDYKYVAIVDCDITKEGTEDGVYEATLTLQEMPIATMYPQSFIAGRKIERKNPLLKANGELAIKALDLAGGQGTFLGLLGKE